MAAWENSALLKGKVIVVTGSASSIGFETARLCTAMGATVLGVDVNKRFDHVEEFYRAVREGRCVVDNPQDVSPASNGSQLQLTDNLEMCNDFRSVGSGFVKPPTTTSPG